LIGCGCYLMLGCSRWLLVCSVVAKGVVGGC